MTAKRKVYIYANDTDLSVSVRKNLEDHLKKNGFEAAPSYSADESLLICIGGDGTFLHFVQNLGFPECPVLGINTGHLGFFQEVMPDEINGFIEKYSSGKYVLQRITPVKALVHIDGEVRVHTGLNEVMIRGPYTHITHLSVELDGNLIQEFSGDGILFSTPVGSTAYNYALGGAIISPDIDVFQMTPVAPSNTNAYRCFHSSIMYAAENTVRLIPRGKTATDTITVAHDGLSSEYKNVSMVEIVKSDKHINIIRFENYNYWAKLTSKLL